MLLPYFKFLEMNHLHSLLNFSLFFIFVFVLHANATPTPRDYDQAINLLTSVKQTNSNFLCGSSGIRRRKEIRNLTPTELNRWRTVMTSLMTERPPNPRFNPPPSFWDLLVAVHIVHRGQAHNGAYFMPWHRLFLFFLENHIRTNFYSDFTLPYWDWSSPLDAPDPALSSVWSTSYLGGSRTGPSTIPNGPFAGLRAHYLNNHPIRRGFDNRVSGSIRPFVNSSAIQAVVSNNYENWGDFSDAVETAHNIVHNDIGGDMVSTATSPNDPVFYLHHAFVDKIWADRQKIYGNDEFGGTHDFIINGVRRQQRVRSSFVFGYYNIPVSTVLEQNCVEYVPYSPPSTALSGLKESNESVPDVCDETEMNTERCRKGEAMIEKAAGETFQT